MMPNTTIDKIEHILLDLLNQSLHSFSRNETFNQTSESASLFRTKGRDSLNDWEWDQLFSLADRHEVLTLLNPILEQNLIPGELWQQMEPKLVKTVYTGMQLQVLDARLTKLLEREDIHAVTLKGMAVSRFYPVPEFRKSTDIDLFVDGRKNAERAVKLLCAEGFKLSEDWHANHHFVLRSKKGEEVELHTTWTEAFKGRHLNQYLKRLQKESSHHCQLVEVQGFQFYAYDIAWQGYYLLLHMLQHFVGSGFGLRNLCDWVVLWEKCDDEKVRNDFWNMVCESGMVEFAKTVTGICTDYLGLSREKSPVPAGYSAEPELVDALLRDILDAGEFGYSEAERMVGMNGNSMAAYVREFHHQMHINFPKAGRVFLFWPPLWGATLIRFLRNNKRLNRAPIGEIIKKAGKRGTLVRQLTIGDGVSRLF